VVVDIARAPTAMR